jgi:tetratricopeptide (TPR) repeat protein
MELRHWARQYLLAITMLLALSGFAPAMAQPDDLAALNRQIGQLYQASRYDEAIPLAQRLVELSGTRFGKESREHANALAVLGDLYREKGRYAEAEPLYQSVRDKLEKALGQNHREVGRASTGWHCCIGPRAVTQRPSHFTNARSPSTKRRSVRQSRNRHGAQQPCRAVCEARQVR